MKRIFLTLALLGVFLQASANVFSPAGSTPVQAPSQIATIIDNTKYPLAAIIFAGVLYGIYRAYNYFNGPSAAFKTALKNKFKLKYRNAFIAYLDHTLTTIDIEKLKASKAQLIKDALQWLPVSPKSGDVVQKRKKRAEIFNETSIESYHVKKDAFNELFDELVLIFSLKKR